VVKIEKSYPGQAVKVMNSLWGAGQMMFNKVLVVVDDRVDIHDHNSILKAFSEKFNPDYSLHFSKGPLDVLDHSSGKFAFGSKLGIDLTQPFPEESVDENIIEKNESFNTEALKKLPWLNDFRKVDDISALLLAVSKNDDFDKKQFEKALLEIPGISSFKFILVFNNGADLNDSFTLLWLMGGNLEPARDVSVLNSGTVLVDATFKTQQHDNFKRDWPNIVTMDEKIIKTIDEKWGQLGLGEFIPSPSLKFTPLIKGEGAVRK
jgi:4-hydroxy-3-polyprenylbenzoate decarboxylase